MKVFKKILISGKNGYVAIYLKKFLESTKEYVCDIIDLKSNDWINYSFSKYDVVVHTAALVHQKEKEHSFEEYKNINFCLTEKIARKARAEHVKHFIFFSTEAVYGLIPRINKAIIINGKTPTKPISKYGITKLMAENMLQKLENNSFSVAILRCPVIYGEGCKGNYNALRALALKCVVFPRIENKKSFLYIGNLCNCVKHIIDTKYRGLISPQNKEYTSTLEMVRLIKKYNNKKGHFSYFLGLIVRTLFFMKPIKKAFGNTCIDQSISKFEDNYDYQTYSLEKSIELTEK